jgi:hypothetical protein
MLHVIDVDYINILQGFLEYDDLGSEMGFHKGL